MGTTLMIIFRVKKKKKHWDLVINATGDFEMISTSILIYNTKLL